MQKRSRYRLEFEPVPLPADFPIVAGGLSRQSDAPIRRLHIHDCLEIGYCYTGTGIFVVEDKVLPFEPGVVSVVDRTEMHLARSAGGESCWEFLFLDPARLVDAPSAEASLSCQALSGAGFPNVLRQADHPDVASLVRKIIQELKSDKPSRQAAVRALVWLLMVHLQRIASASRAPRTAAVQRGVIERIAPALEYLAHNYDRPVYVQHLAKLCHASVPTMRRWMHAGTGVSPAQYVTQLRLQMASVLLSRTTRSVLDISLAVGYPTLSSFNRHFKRHMGMSPRDWRRRKRVGFKSLDEYRY